MKTNNIIAAPVKKYSTPKYPTRIVADRSPELLRKLPSRWQKNAAVVTAAGLLGVITLTSCGLLEPKNNTGTGYNPGSVNLLNVAPVFIHGEGTGSMGCMMIAPPVFLSEEEALAVIKSEIETAGLDLSAKPPEYIATDNKHREISQYSWENQHYVLGGGSVGLELYDAQKGVAATFISMEEAEQIFPNGPWISFTDYNPRELAELTVEDFSKQNGDIAIGVFYDPGKDWESEEQKRILDEYDAKRSEITEKYRDTVTQLIEEENREEYDKEYSEALAEYEANAKSIIEEDLRLQVRDFIEWLQGQGII